MYKYLYTLCEGKERKQDLMFCERRTLEELEKNRVEDRSTTEDFIRPVIFKTLGKANVSGISATGSHICVVELRDQLIEQIARKARNY